MHAMLGTGDKGCLQGPSGPFDMIQSRPRRRAVSPQVRSCVGNHCPKQHHIGLAPEHVPSPADLRGIGSTLGKRRAAIVGGNSGETATCASRCGGHGQRRQNAYDMYTRSQARKCAEAKITILISSEFKSIERTLN
jgi:hypothetical protein